MTKPPDYLRESRLIIAEGADAYYFCMWAYQAFGGSGIQVLDSGSVADLEEYLRLLRVTPGFDAVTSILIARDAETDPRAAVDSVRHSLASAGLPQPVKPFEFLDGPPRVAFALFPGYVVDSTGRQQLQPGTLEHLCLGAVASDPVMGCVDEFLECVKRNGEDCRQAHKNRLHAFLAGKANCAGYKLGEATRAGVWNLEHEVFRPYKELILAL